jgi:dienelactone hydrolase
MHPSAGNATLDTIHPFHTQRAEDMNFLAGVLKDWLRRLGVHTGSGNALKIEAFGHSLGGATTAGAMQRTKLIQAGINMDGFFVNRTPTDDAIKNVERPFVIMGAGEHNSTSEETWREWKKHQSGGTRS